MNIVIRNMIPSDIEDLPRAFASQGWLMPASIFQHHYNRVLHKNSEMLIAEVNGQPAGYVRMEWLNAGEEGPALTPEVQEFIVLARYAGLGVAEAMIYEADRRVSSKTGEITGNTLMAVYGDPPLRPNCRCSYVLDGLLVGNDGSFIRAKTAADRKKGMVISLKRSRKV